MADMPFLFPDIGIAAQGFLEAWLLELFTVILPSAPIVSTAMGTTDGLWALWDSLDIDSVLWLLLVMVSPFSESTSMAI